MDAPHAGYLWLLDWLAAASVAAGTLVLFAVLGTQGQIIALLVFIYLGLASSGGTVPLQALPGVLKLVSQIEPLRQILSGTRAMLYFGAAGDAGLTREIIAASAGLIFWLALGATAVRWYDRKGFHRIQPDLLAYVQRSVATYRADPQHEGGDKDRERLGPASVEDERGSREDAAPEQQSRLGTGHGAAGEEQSESGQPSAEDHEGDSG